MKGELSGISKRIQDAELVRVTGKVQSVVGLSIRVSLPGSRLGELVQIHRRALEPLLCEVVAFSENQATLMPLGDPKGVGPGDEVQSTGAPLRIHCSEALLGRVLDGLGNPVDGAENTEGERWEVMRSAPDALKRPRVTEVLPLGVRAIDALLTVGHGQRIGLFAGSGVGKSSLLGQIARQAAADVCVLCLLGERGREVREFLEDSLGEEGKRKSVVVCASSDAPALVRLKSAHTATAIAEWFRDQGKQVLLLVDSLTRFARAAREVGLAAGEPPARRGFPPSVFAALPRLLERSGNSEKGSITAFYTVLVEGGDMDEPIADEVRGILDGHIVLSRNYAERGHFPAIDILQSLSRVMRQLVSDEQLKHATQLRKDLSLYEENHDLINLGAYKKGTNPQLDRAIGRMETIENFLKQDQNECCDYKQCVELLSKLSA